VEAVGGQQGIDLARDDPGCDERGASDREAFRFRQRRGVTPEALRHHARQRDLTLGDCEVEALEPPLAQGVPVEALTEGPLGFADLPRLTRAGSSEGQDLADGLRGAVQVGGLGIGQVVVRQNRVEHLARHGSDRLGREALGRDPVSLRRPRGRLAALGLAHGRLHQRVQLVPPRDGEPAVAGAERHLDDLPAVERHRAPAPGRPKLTLEERHDAGPEASVVGELTRVGSAGQVREARAAGSRHGSPAMWILTSALTSPARVPSESHSEASKNSALAQKWSGRRESNPRMQLGKLPFYH
jgi:hypothetical protein